MKRITHKRKEGVLRAYQPACELRQKVVGATGRQQNVFTQTKREHVSSHGITESCKNLAQEKEKGAWRSTVSHTKEINDNQSLFKYKKK